MVLNYGLISRMRITIFLFFLIVLLGCSKQQSPELKNKIDDIFEDVDSNSPGYVIAVIRDGEYIFKEGYGLAHLEYDIPITERTVFNIASLSKQFTAACIALLILEDKLTLEDSVSKYVDDFPKQWSHIKVKHLIYMTSGINDYYYNPRANGTDWSSLNFFNVDTAIVAAYSSSDLMYEPGSQWSYSNINYMLLTKVVEKVSGQSFAQFSEERIFKPLEMNATLVNDDVFTIIPNRALGYNYRDEQNTEWMIKYGYIPEGNDDSFLQINRVSAHYGGSGIYTSVDDLKKWFTNFETKEFGGDAFDSLMHMTVKFDHEKANDAFGLVHSEYEGRKMIWYEGGDWGYSTYFMRFPETGTTIICLSNLGTGRAADRARKVADILIESKDL